MYSNAQFRQFAKFIYFTFYLFSFILFSFISDNKKIKVLSNIYNFTV